MSLKYSLKIPKVLSETVYRRTDNTMANRKSTKRQTTIDKTYISFTLSDHIRRIMLKKYAKIEIDKDVHYIIIINMDYN